MQPFPSLSRLKKIRKTRSKTDSSIQRSLLKRLSNRRNWLPSRPLNWRPKRLNNRSLRPSKAQVKSKVKLKLSKLKRRPKQLLAAANKLSPKRGE